MGGCGVGGAVAPLIANAVGNDRIEGQGAGTGDRPTGQAGAGRDAGDRTAADRRIPEDLLRCRRSSGAGRPSWRKGDHTVPSRRSRVPRAVPMTASSRVASDTARAAAPR